MPRCSNDVTHRGHHSARYFGLRMALPISQNYLLALLYINTENIFSNNLSSTISTKNSRWKKKKLGRFSRLIFSVWPCWPFRWFVWGSGRTLRWPGPRCRPPWGPSSQLLWPDPVDTGKWPPQPRSSGSCRIAWKERWNLLVWKAEAAFKERKLFK